MIPTVVKLILIVFQDSPGYTPTARDDRKIRCRDYDEKGFCLKGDQCKFDHGTDALVLEDAAAGIVPYQPANVPPPPAALFSGINLEYT